MVREPAMDKLMKPSETTGKYVKEESEENVRSKQIGFQIKDEGYKGFGSIGGNEGFGILIEDED